MKQVFSLTQQPWHRLGVYDRIVLQFSAMMMYPLSPDERLSILINLMSEEIIEIADTDDAVDAVIDMLRINLKHVYNNGRH